MIHKVKILESALKHGFALDDIAFAWCNYVRDSKDYGRENQSVHVRVGTTKDAVMLEMIAAWDEQQHEWHVFHAMKPAKGLLTFLGLEGNNAHRD